MFSFFILMKRGIAAFTMAIMLALSVNAEVWTNIHSIGSYPAMSADGRVFVVAGYSR